MTAIDRAAHRWGSVLVTVPVGGFGRRRSRVCAEAGCTTHGAHVLRAPAGVFNGVEVRMCDPHAARLEDRGWTRA